MKLMVIDAVRGLVGAVLGGVLGFYTFGWLHHQGFYGLAVPGALLGLGAGLLAGRPSLVRGVLCGLAAVALALYTEWRYWPFDADESLGYFATHLTRLRPLTLLMTAVGGLAAFWLGKDAGLRGMVRSAASAPPAAEKPRDDS